MNLRRIFTRYLTLIYLLAAAGVVAGIHLYPKGEAALSSFPVSAGILFLLFALYLLQIFLTCRLLRPLEELRERIALIASQPEKLGEELREPAVGELASLARSFNVLSATLRRERDLLEETVAARTAELRQSNERLRDDAVLREVVEEELRASKVVLQSLVEASPVPILAFDLAGSIRLWNRAAERVFGWKAREVLGGPNVLVPPERRSDFDDLFSRIVGGETLEGVEIVRQRRDGSPVHLSIYSSALRSPEGEPVAVMSVMEDISTRLRTEGELRAAQERLETLVNNAPMVLIAFDAQGRIVLAKGKVLEGIDRRSFYGQPLPERFSRVLLHREDAPATTFASALAAALDGKGVAGEVEIAGRFYDCRLLPLPGGGGESGALALGFDVTDRRDAEERLRENERSYRLLSEEFRALLDGIPDSLTLIEEGVIVWANQGTLQLYALEEDPTGKKCRSAFGCGDGLCDSCPVRRTFASGQTESGRLQTPDGRFWGVKAFSLRERQGSGRRVIRWASNITEQLRIQENAMRSARLASLGELAAGVAHEINNPTGLILLNSALLRDVFADLEPMLEERFSQEGDFVVAGLRYGRLRDDLPHLFSDTLDAAQRIRRIVEDLKNFARQDVAELAEEVDINDSCRMAARLLGPTVAKATSAFAMNLEEGLPSVRGNAQRLEQVIVNLLMNACQSLPDRSRALCLATRCDRSAVYLEVRDEGTGISPEVLSRITDPFFTTRRETGGTGLGLSVSARIIKEHGGELRFDSSPGSGTTVTVCIPLPKDDHDQLPGSDRFSESAPPGSAG